MQEEAGRRKKEEEGGMRRKEKGGRSDQFNCFVPAAGVNSAGRHARTHFYIGSLGETDF